MIFKNSKMYQECNALTKMIFKKSNMYREYTALTKMIFKNSKMYSIITTCLCAHRCFYVGIKGARTKASPFATHVRAKRQKTGEKRFKQGVFCRAGAHRRDEATRLCAPTEAERGYRR